MEISSPSFVCKGSYTVSLCCGLSGGCSLQVRFMDLCTCTFACAFCNTVRVLASQARCKMSTFFFFPQRKAQKIETAAVEFKWVTFLNLLDGNKVGIWRRTFEQHKEDAENPFLRKYAIGKSPVYKTPLNNNERFADTHGLMQTTSHLMRKTQWRNQTKCRGKWRAEGMCVCVKSLKMKLGASETL